MITKIESKSCIEILENKLETYKRAYRDLIHCILLFAKSEIL